MNRGASRRSGVMARAVFLRWSLAATAAAAATACLLLLLAAASSSGSQWSPAEVLRDAAAAWSSHYKVRWG
jgi:hypothetical protein